MYYKWLDSWDEKRAQGGEANKLVSDFKLDAHLAFTNGRNAVSLEDFCRLADAAGNDPSFFDPPEARVSDFERFEGGVRFSSDLETGDPENDTVWAKVTESGSRDRALVIFHHWNAKSRQSQIAKYFSRRGMYSVNHLVRQRQPLWPVYEPLWCCLFSGILVCNLLWLNLYRCCRWRALVGLLVVAGRAPAETLCIHL